VSFEDFELLTQAHIGRLRTSEHSASEKEIMERVVLIARKHAALAGRSLHRDDVDTFDWSSFGSFLKDAILPDERLLDDPKLLAFLREMVAEIYDCLHHAYAGDPSQQVYYLLDSFGWDGQPFARLLPDRAKPALWKARDIAEAAAETQRLRDDQMGY